MQSSTLRCYTRITGKYELFSTSYLKFTQWLYDKILLISVEVNEDFILLM